MLVDSSAGNADLCDVITVEAVSIVKCETKKYAEANKITSPHQIGVKVISTGVVEPCGMLTCPTSVF